MPRITAQSTLAELEEFLGTFSLSVRVRPTSDGRGYRVRLESVSHPGTNEIDIVNPSVAKAIAEACNDISIDARGRTFED